MSIFSLLHIFLLSLIWSSVSIIVKFELRPTAEACFLKSFAQMEWNVPSQERPMAEDPRI